MGRVFVSYRRQDSADAAWRIHASLEQRFGPQSVFIDVDSIAPGVDFRRQLDAALDESKALVAVIGPGWLDARYEQGSKAGQRRLDDPYDYVAMELRGALHRDMPVIPVLVGGAQMPGRESLHPDLQPLVYRNATELGTGPDSRSQVDRLVRAVEAFVGAPAPEPAPGRRRMWIAVVSAIALVGIGVGVLLATRPHSGNGNASGTPTSTPAPAPPPAPAPSTPHVPSLSSARPTRDWPSEVGAYLAPWATTAGSEVDATTGFPSRIRRTVDGMEMVLVPAGRFQMGRAEADKPIYDDETPRHWVTLTKAFYMDEHEVTVGMWNRYLASRGAPPVTADGTEEHPISDVSWAQVEGYLAWAHVDLPTEAQWERAARGGNDDTRYAWGIEDDPLHRNGQGAGDGFTKKAPVKSFPANAYGLYDMCGNVFEWCADWYEAKYYASSPAEDPQGPAVSPEGTRVLRGGSYNSAERNLRVYYRDRKNPEVPGPLWGFRCARVLR